MTLDGLEGCRPSYLKAERHLEQTGGIAVSARQIQRVVQRVGSAAQQWQERPAKPGSCQHGDAPILYLSGDGTGVPMVPEELVGRKGKIVDFYHAMEHADSVLDALLGKAHPDYKGRLRSWAERLLKDDVELLITEARRECAGKAQAPAVEEALH